MSSQNSLVVFDFLIKKKARNLLIDYSMRNDKKRKKGNFSILCTV